MPEFKISAIPYEECKNDLISFRNANRDTRRDAAYFDWRYTGRPNGLAPVIVWAEDGDRRKVGSISLIPHHYRAYGAERVFGVLGDISVDKDCRGKGIAKRMFGYLFGLEAVKSLDACIVLPNDDAARPLEKSGWTTVAKVVRHVKFLNVESLLEKKHVSGHLKSIVAPCVNNLLGVFSYETFFRHSSGYAGAVSDRFDERFDALWDNLKKDGMIAGTRSREYLTWRYAMHPHVKYQVFTLTRGPVLCGYIVFYIEGNACYISDILSVSENRCPVRLMSFFLNHIKQNKFLSSVVFPVSRSNQMPVSLASFGFFKRPDYLRLMVGPDTERRYLDVESWYLTAGDKDV